MNVFICGNNSLSGECAPFSSVDSALLLHPLYASDLDQPLFLDIHAIRRFKWKLIVYAVGHLFRYECAYARMYVRTYICMYAGKLVSDCIVLSVLYAVWWAELTWLLRCVVKTGTQPQHACNTSIYNAYVCTCTQLITLHHSLFATAND